MDKSYKKICEEKKNKLINELSYYINDQLLLDTIIDKIVCNYNSNLNYEVCDNYIAFFKKNNPVLFVKVSYNEITYIDYLVNIKYHFYFDNDFTHVFINHHDLKEYLLFNKEQLVQRRLRGVYYNTNVYRIEHYDGKEIYICKLHKSKSEDDYKTDYYHVSIDQVITTDNLNALGYVFTNKEILDCDTYQLKIKKEN